MEVLLMAVSIVAVIFCLEIKEASSILMEFWSIEQNTKDSLLNGAEYDSILSKFCWIILIFQEKFVLTERALFL
jgi:hypothetical protein